jgi:hypothetical protein
VSLRPWAVLQAVLATSTCCKVLVCAVCCATAGVVVIRLACTYATVSTAGWAATIASGLPVIQRQLNYSTAGLESGSHGRCWWSPPGGTRHVSAALLGAATPLRIDYRISQVHRTLSKLPADSVWGTQGCGAAAVNGMCPHPGVSSRGHPLPAWSCAAWLAEAVPQHQQ